MRHTRTANDPSAATTSAKGRKLIQQATVADMRALLSVLTTRGDLIRRGASAEERFASTIPGQVVTWNGTDTLFRDPLRFHTMMFMSATATAVGARTTGILAVTSNDAGIPVPSGTTFKLWHMDATLKTGATVGTNYDLEMIVREKLSATDTQIWTSLDNANDTNVIFYRRATNINSPICSIAGPERLHLGWGVLAASTGALAAVNHCVTAVYSIE